MTELGRVMSDDLVRRVAEQRLVGRRGEDETPLRVGDPDHVAGVLDDEPVELLALAQRLLRPVLLADAEPEALHVEGLALLVADELAAPVDPDLAAVLRS